MVDNVLIINPGPLSKRRGAGTYAQMTLYRREVSDEDRAEKQLVHNIFNRARVDITRI